MIPGSGAAVFKTEYERDSDGTIDSFTSGFMAGALIGAAAGGFVSPTAIVGGLWGGTVTGIISAIEGGKIPRVRLTEEGKNWLDSRVQSGDFAPYEWVAGDSEKGIGIDGRIYLKTTGMVKAYVACDSCNGLKSGGLSQDQFDCADCEKNKLIYFGEQIDKDGNKVDYFTELYQKEYLDQLQNCDDPCKNVTPDSADKDKDGYKDDLCYAHKALEYLKKIYTYAQTSQLNNETGVQSQPILMYSQRVQEYEEATIEYINETKAAEDVITSAPDLLNKWFGGSDPNPIIRSYVPKTQTPVTLQTINYDTKVAEYATPMELMVNLLTITSSKEFLNAFMETVGNDNYVKLKLYTTRNRDISVIGEEFTRETQINLRDKRYNYVARITKQNKEGWDLKGSQDYNGSQNALRGYFDYGGSNFKITSFSRR